MEHPLYRQRGNLPHRPKNVSSRPCHAMEFCSQYSPCMILIIASHKSTKEIDVPFNSLASRSPGLSSDKSVIANSNQSVYSGVYSSGYRMKEAPCSGSWAAWQKKYIQHVVVYLTHAREIRLVTVYCLLLPTCGLSPAQRDPWWPWPDACCCTYPEAGTFKMWFEPWWWAGSAMAASWYPPGSPPRIPPASLSSPFKLQSMIWPASSLGLGGRTRLQWRSCWSWRECQPSTEWWSRLSCARPGSVYTLVTALTAAWTLSGKCCLSRCPPPPLPSESPVQLVPVPFPPPFA